MAKKESTKKFVKIHSDVTIAVTPGLQNKNVTDVNSRVGDKLRVIPQWHEATILIKKGEGLYPAEIVEWPTVKKLADAEIFTIGSYVDDLDSAQLKGNNDEAKKEKIEKAKKDEETLKDATFLKLNSISEE